MAASKINKKNLDAAGREQAVLILASLMEWQGGEIHVYVTKGSSRKQLDLKMPLPELLVLAARRAVQEHCIPSAFNSLQGTISPISKNREALLAVPLDSAEALACSLLKNPFTHRQT